MGERVRGGRGSASPAAISTGRRRRVFSGGEKKAKQTHSVCLDLKGKEGREDILAARLERRVDVCSVRRPRQHCDCSVAVRTLGR